MVSSWILHKELANSSFRKVGVKAEVSDANKEARDEKNLTGPEL